MNSDPPLVYDDNDSRGSTLDMLHVEDEQEENTDGLDVEMVNQQQCCGGLKKSAVCSVL